MVCPCGWSLKLYSTRGAIHVADSTDTTQWTQVKMVSEVEKHWVNLVGCACCIATTAWELFIKVILVDLTPAITLLQLYYHCFLLTIIRFSIASEQFEFVVIILKGKGVFPNGKINYLIVIVFYN